MIIFLVVENTVGNKKTIIKVPDINMFEIERVFNFIKTIYGKDKPIRIYTRKRRDLTSFVATGQQDAGFVLTEIEKPSQSFSQLLQAEMNKLVESVNDLSVCFDQEMKTMRNLFKHSSCFAY